MCSAYPSVVALKISTYYIPTESLFDAFQAATYLDLEYKLLRLISRILGKAHERDRLAASFVEDLLQPVVLSWAVVGLPMELICDLTCSIRCCSHGIAISTRRSERIMPRT